MPQVKIEIRRNRAKILRNLGDNLYIKTLTKQVFKKHKVLIERENGIGKTENNFNVKLKNSNKGEILEILPKKIENNFLQV